jgi:mono/diheme cytochrome c family protein
MKKNVRSTLIFVASALVMFGISSGFKLLEQKPWPVPDKYKTMKNAVASDAESITAGKALWATHCKSCHGSKGLGDGAKAAQLKTEPGDFSKAEVQAQPDGSFFYKISEGRDDMPGFKKKIPDQDDIWSIINFVRTLKK